MHLYVPREGWHFFYTGSCVGEDPRRELVLLEAVQFEIEVPPGGKPENIRSADTTSLLERIFEFNLLLSVP